MAMSVEGRDSLSDSSSLREAFILKNKKIMEFTIIGHPSSPYLVKIMENFEKY